MVMSSSAKEGDDVQFSINKLREALADDLKLDPRYDDPWFLLSWLKVHQFNVEKAEGAVRGAIKARKEINFESFANQQFDPWIFSQFPIHFDGLTKEGIPIMTVAVGGDIDHRKIVSRIGREGYLKYWHEILSKLDHMGLVTAQKGDPSKMTANTKVGLVIIADVSDYRLTQASCLAVIQTWIEILKMYKKATLGCCRTLYITNVNRVFSSVLKLLIPWIEGPCIDMHVFGTNDKAKLKAMLSDLVEPHQIRIPFGGTRV